MRERSLGYSQSTLPTNPPYLVSPTLIDSVVLIPRLETTVMETITEPEVRPLFRSFQACSDLSLILIGTV